MGVRNRHFGLGFLFLVLLVAGGLGVPAAHGQEKEQKKENEPPVSQKSVKIFLDKIEVTGQIAKPQAVFIIPGSDPTVDDIKLDRSFFQEIFRKVERDDIGRRQKRARSDHIPW
jgi:hypothetical protein